MRFFLNNFELILSGAGLVVILAVTIILSRLGLDAWHMAAITATGVGVLHGAIFWVVRRRQREVRRATLREVQGMLRDIINNQLTIIRGVSQMPQAPGFGSAVARIDSSVELIADALRTLSEERLTEWKQRYAHRTDSPPSVGGR